MTYILGKRSRSRLIGLHPDLVRVCKRGIFISSIDWTVIEGLRDREQQRRNIANGVSWTMRSRHLTGHGVDIAPWVGGGIDYNAVEQWVAMGHAICRAAQELNILITWGALKKYGGDWSRQNDMGHFELKWSVYPTRRK